MTLYFITGNDDKYREAALVMPELRQLKLKELTEIQELDSKPIIEHKLRQAMERHQGELVVEDTALYARGMKRLPGPLITWFLKELGPEGIARMVASTGDTTGLYVVTVGYANGDDIQYFSGEVLGDIVMPRGAEGFRGFGFDPIFQPRGETRTYGQMTIEEKVAQGARTIAFQKLKEYRASRRSP